MFISSSARIPFIVRDLAHSEVGSRAKLDALVLSLEMSAQASVKPHVSIPVESGIQKLPDLLRKNPMAEAN